MDFQKVKKRIIIYVVAIAIISATATLSALRILDNYELELLDARYNLRPKISTNKNIVIIEIGDDTIDKIGKWPISRRYHATFIDALMEAKVKAIVFDVFFSEESEEAADNKLSEAIKKSGIVYLPHIFNIVFQGKKDVPVADKLQEGIIDKFKKYAKGVGFINIIPDIDGKYRRVPPLIKYQGKLYPHVCFLLAADYLGFKREDMTVKPGKSVTLGDIKVPLDSNSNIIVNFPGKWIDTFRHYSYIDVIDSYIATRFPESIGKKPIIDLDTLKDSVCFIGVTATATPDAHPSPFDSVYPGVGVHASLFNSLLDKKFIERANRSTNIIILLLLCFITYLVSKQARRTLLGFFLVFLFILCYILFAIGVFIFWGLWLDIFYPIVVMVIFYLGLMFMKYIGETQKIEIMERELSIAKNIQESFLPKEKPDVPGIEISAKMVTALQVGGDLYDFLKISDKKAGVMIGDVSGKGVPAALYMAKVVSEFKSYTNEAFASEAIKKLNNQLCEESGSGLFVTLSYLIFDTETASVSYSSGGHLPLIIARENETEPLVIDLKEGTPLGLFEGDFSEEKIQYKKGDKFILYTDGVTEAMDPKGEMYGQERLVDLVKKNSSLGPEEIVELIQNEINKFEGKQKQHDDITAMVVKIL